jgi:hypothetical protein
LCFSPTIASNLRVTKCPILKTTSFRHIWSRWQWQKVKQSKKPFLNILKLHKVREQEVLSNKKMKKRKKKLKNICKFKTSLKWNWKTVTNRQSAQYWSLQVEDKFSIANSDKTFFTRKPFSKMSLNWLKKKNMKS